MSIKQQNQHFNNFGQTNTLTSSLAFGTLDLTRPDWLTWIDVKDPPTAPMKTQYRISDANNLCECWVSKYFFVIDFALDYMLLYIYVLTVSKTVKFYQIP